MARTCHVLVLAPDQNTQARLARMLVGAGMASRTADVLTGDEIAFAHRVGEVVIVAGYDDPLARLTYVRLAGIDLPVLVLHGARRQREQLLEAGAAAVAPMPRSADALAAGVRAAIEHETRKARPAGLVFDPVALSVAYRERSVELTRREYAVLESLAARADQPVSIARLQAHAWGDALPKQSAPQIVTVYVHQLRRKLRAIGLDRAIVTVRNFGYRLVPPATGADDHAAARSVARRTATSSSRRPRRDRR